MYPQDHLHPTLSRGSTTVLPPGHDIYDRLDKYFVYMVRELLLGAPLDDSRAHALPRTCFICYSTEMSMLSISIVASNGGDILFPQAVIVLSNGFAVGMSFRLSFGGPSPSSDTATSITLMSIRSRSSSISPSAELGSRPMCAVVGSSSGNSQQR